jgi:hypothetical protein
MNAKDLSIRRQSGRLSFFFIVVQCSYAEDLELTSGKLLGTLIIPLGSS